MRLTYLAIPFVAVLLTACGDDERDVDSYNEPAPASGTEYSLPDEPVTVPSSPSTTTPPPGMEGMSSGAVNEPGRKAASDALTEPDTMQGTGAIH